MAVGKIATKYYSKFNNNVINFPYSIEIKKRNKKFFKNNKINFLYVGQLVKRKNVINLVKAFSKIKNEKIVLRLVGEGESKKIIKKFIAKDKRIKIIRFQNGKGLVKYFNESDVFILPSSYDGWGVVVTEAMSFKNAIISTKNSGVANDLISNKKNGLLINPTEESIYKAIKFYIQNKNFIKKHGLINSKKKFILQNVMC